MATPREEARTKARQRAKEWARNTLGSRTKTGGSKTMPRQGSGGAYSFSPLIVIDGDDDDPRRFARENGTSMEHTKTTTSTTECRTPSLRERMSRIDIEGGIFATPNETRVRDAPCGSMSTNEEGSIGNDEDVFHDAFEYLPTSTTVGRDINADAEDEQRRITYAARILPTSTAVGSDRIYRPTIIRNEAREPIGISYSTVMLKPDP